ncbi:unannotated protein [freshwater metagenome]|uniref:Unannotated protein n=1 Tax=freshwater metagenome TaxID=449393 RepID=A0A6J7EAQ0_9ZZZZ
MTEEPKFSRMMAIVAVVVAATILLFFGVGYGLAKLLL